MVDNQKLRIHSESEISIRTTNMKKLVFVLSLFLLSACNEVEIPRPRGYFRIALPPKEYLNLPDSFPYGFKIPAMVQLIKDQGPNAQAEWLNLHYPVFNAEIHISYHKVKNNLQELLNDTYDLSYKHTVKADAIEEIPIYNAENRVFGTFYDIEGNAASQIQFFVTDSVNHYFRAALYFNQSANRDSLNPVVEYIKQDMKMIYETLYWRNTYNH